MDDTRPTLRVAVGRVTCVPLDHAMAQRNATDAGRSGDGSVPSNSYGNREAAR